VMDEELDELDRVIALIENSDWDSPLVPVIKENGKLGLCADYKITVNKHIKYIKYPLPRIEELFAALQGDEQFTKLDLKSAYNQLELTGTTKRIAYLGHYIDKDGLHKDKGKVRAIVEARRPKDVSEVKKFVGMINYYGKFVPELSIVLEPLYSLLRSNTVFNWSKNCEKAFLKAKEISSEQSLAHFDANLPIKLVCDASDMGVGAVLLHIYQDGSEKP
ncbi:hypothetical protein ILUMI_20421, partial [Ignelater luminosus]